MQVSLATATRTRHKLRTPDHDQRTQNAKSQHASVDTLQTLQESLDEAVTFDSYMSIIVNGMVTVWHVESGPP